MMSKFSFVIKRSGAIVPFNADRIANVIYRAAVSVGGRDKEKAAELAQHVIAHMEKQFDEDYKPHVEEIQDIVEKVLIDPIDLDFIGIDVDKGFLKKGLLFQPAGHRIQKFPGPERLVQGGGQLLETFLALA